MNAPDHSSMAQKDERRSRRQSRMTRESVSTEDSTLLVTPTREWQDQLASRIGVPSSKYGTNSSRDVPDPNSPASSRAWSQEPRRQKRRLDDQYTAQNANQAQTYREPSASDDSYANWDEVDDAVDSFGHLSLDESKEIRYHGHASGLPLLAKSDIAETQSSKEDGIWKFPMLQFEAATPHFDYWAYEDGAGVDLPPADVQNHLIDLYFTYVHPFFPVMHKQSFMSEFGATVNRSAHPDFRPNDPVDRQPVQRLSKLLLLAMYAVASRYSDASTQSAANTMPQNAWDQGMSYAERARRILHNVYQFSRPSTCQALLLFGIREFGLGSMQSGWIYTGIALRMAIDLGLNRNADNWTQGGSDLFTPFEKQTRKQIWWCSCTIDKLSSIWLGRPITFRSKDYSTLRPDIEVQEEYELWRPVPPESLGSDFEPLQAHILSCFQEACAISAIMTEIMDSLYPVRLLEQKSRRDLLEPLEARLHHWLFNLPDHLRYSPASLTHVPLPHILMLHIEYCAAVLLLHRAFLPKWNRREGKEEDVGSDTLPLKSFDLCQSAASHISTIVTIYHEKFGLDRCPPFLSIYLQSAGIMHVVTLARRPLHPQASMGLMQCITALKLMEPLWPGSTRVRSLLEGAKVELDQSSSDPQGRQKRNSEDAFGSESIPSTMDRRSFQEQLGTPSEAIPSTGSNALTSSEDEVNMRIMAHSLGLDLPGLEASTIFYPGYQWWPRPNMDHHAMQEMFPTQFDPLTGLYTMSGGPSTQTSGMPSGRSSASASGVMPTQDYLQGAHYPILDRTTLYPPNVNFHGPGNPGNPGQPGL